MTNIDFYFNASNVHSVAQRLISKAIATKQTVVVCGAESDLQAFDSYLWAFDPVSFIPHGFAGSSIAEQTPVLLSSTLADLPQSHDGLLIHISLTVPSLFSRFERVLELVGIDEPSKIAGRDRFKHYKSRGYPMKMFDLAKP